MRYKYILYYFIFALVLSACGGGSGGGGDNNNNGGGDDNQSNTNTVSFSLNGSKVTGLTIESNDIKTKTSEVTIGVSNTITTLKIGTLEIAKINTEELKSIIATSGSSKNSVVELLDYLSLEGLANDDAKDVLLVIFEATKNSVASVNANAWNSIHKNGELDLGTSLFINTLSELKTIIGDSSTAIDKTSVITNMNSRIIEKTADYIVDNGLDTSSTKDKIKEKLKKSIPWSDYISASFTSEGSYQSIASKINSAHLSTVVSGGSTYAVVSVPKPSDRDESKRYIVDLYVGTEPFYINHPDETYRNYLSKETFDISHPTITDLGFSGLSPNTLHYFNMVLKYYNTSGIAVTVDAKVQGYVKTFPENMNFSFSEHITMNDRKKTQGLEVNPYLRRVSSIVPDFGYYIEPAVLPKECEQKPFYKYDCSFFKERVAYIDNATFREYTSADPKIITAVRLTVDSIQAKAICENILNQNSEIDNVALEAAEPGILLLKNQYKRDAAYSSSGAMPYGRDVNYSFHPKHFYAFKEDATKYPYGESEDKLIVKSGYPKLVNSCIHGGFRGSSMHNLYAIGEQPTVDYAVANLKIQQSDYTGNCSVLDTPLSVQALKCPSFTAYRLEKPSTRQSANANYTTIRDYSHLPKKAEIGIVGEGQVFLNLPSESASKIFEVTADTGSKQTFTLNGAFNSQKWDGAYFSLKTTNSATTKTWDTSGSCVFKNNDYNKCYFDFNGPIFKADATFYKDNDAVAKGICDNAIVLKNEYQRDASYRLGVDDISIEDSRLPVATGWYAFYEEINSEHGVTSDSYVNLHQGECLQMLQGPAVYPINISSSSTLPSKLFEQTDIDLKVRTIIESSVVCADISTVLDSSETPDFQAKALQCIDKTVYFLARLLKDKTAHATDRSR